MLFRRAPAGKPHPLHPPIQTLAVRRLVSADVPAPSRARSLMVTSTRGFALLTRGCISLALPGSYLGCKGGVFSCALPKPAALRRAPPYACCCPDQPVESGQQPLLIFLSQRRCESDVMPPHSRTPGWRSNRSYSWVGKDGGKSSAYGSINHVRSWFVRAASHRRCRKSDSICFISSRAQPAASRPPGGAPTLMRS
jgi:hypothetical protein